MGYTINGASSSGGGSLPPASAANEIPVSSGAGTTYVATDAAGVRAAIGARATVGDTGWTDVTSGGGTVSRAAGVCTLSVGSGQTVRSHHAAEITPECPAVEVIARFDVTTGIPGSAWWSGLAIASADDAYGVLAQVDDAGAVALWVNTGSGYGLAALAGSVSRTSGETWLRLVLTPVFAAAYYGTGSGSTPPTSWTRTAYLALSSAGAVMMLADGRLTRLQQHAGRASAGSGTYTVEWRDLQARILGLSP